MVYTQGVIKEKILLTSEVYSLWIFAPEISQEAQPGQFVNIRVTGGYEPFLNRPISIADAGSNCIYTVIKIVGRGTEILYHRRIGDKIDLLGPLGKPVKIPQGRKALLVGGGVGIAPLYFLAKHLTGGNELGAILAVRKKKDLILKKEYLKLTKDIHITTEDGSLGSKGTAVSTLRRLVRKASYNIIYACGPRAMLTAIKQLHLKIPVYAFVEDFLGCGCGICLGCALKVNGEYRRICIDGPVFDLRRIQLGD